MLVLQSLASFSCVMHIVCCKQKGKNSSLLLLYKREFDWISIQPIKVPDRQIHVFPTKLLSEGGEQGSRLKGKFSGGGGARHICQLRRGGGCQSEKKSPDLRSPEVGISVVAQQKNLYILDLHQQASLPLAFSYCRFLQNV